MSVLLIVPVEPVLLLEQDLAKLERELKEALCLGNHKKTRRILKKLEEINEQLDWC